MESIVNKNSLKISFPANGEKKKPLEGSSELLNSVARPQSQSWSTITAKCFVNLPCSNEHAINMDARIWVWNRVTIEDLPE